MPISNEYKLRATIARLCARGRTAIPATNSNETGQRPLAPRLSASTHAPKRGQRSHHKPCRKHGRRRRPGGHEAGRRGEGAPRRRSNVEWRRPAAGRAWERRRGEDETGPGVMRDQTRIVLSLDTINSLDHVASDSADAACGGSARLSASDIRSHAIHEMRRTQSPRRRQNYPVVNNRGPRRVPASARKLRTIPTWSAVDRRLVADGAKRPRLSRGTIDAAPKHIDRRIVFRKGALSIPRLGRSQCSHISSDNLVICWSPPERPASSPDFAAFCS